jgi:hypothetical protein
VRATTLAVGDYPERPAPCCGAPLDSATVVGADESVRPDAGDFSICFACGAWLRFTDAEGGMRLLDADDVLDIDNETRAMLTKATAALKVLRAPPSRRRPVNAVVRITWPRK